MAAPSGKLAGFTTGLYTNATAGTTFDATAAAALAITANYIPAVTEFGDLANEDNIIDVAVFGEPVVGHVVGQGTAQEFTFSVALDLANTTHTDLRDDARTTARAFTIAFGTGLNGNVSTDASFCTFNGTVINTSVSTSIDGVTALAVTIRRTTDITWSDVA